VQIAVEDGGVVVRLGSGETTTDTGPMIIRETITRMQQRMGVELDWLEPQLPPEMPEDILRYWMRKLNAIEQLCLRTHADYARAEMEGRLASYLSTPVQGTPPSQTPAASPAAPAGPFAISPGTLAADVAALCMTIAHADGVLDPAEIEVAARVVAETSGVPASSDVEDYLRATKPSPDDWGAAAARLLLTLEVQNRKKLVRALLLVAEADKFVHPSEVEMIVRTGAALGGLDGYAEGLLDARA
jgi:uncharacterized tellurite resistance protein B-like protein